MIDTCNNPLLCKMSRWTTSVTTSLHGSKCAQCVRQLITQRGTEATMKSNDIKLSGLETRLKVDLTRLELHHVAGIFLKIDY